MRVIDNIKDVRQCAPTYCHIVLPSFRLMNNEEDVRKTDVKKVFLKVRKPSYFIHFLYLFF